MALMKNERGVLISSILAALEQGVRRKNRRLIEQGAQHSEQEAFERGDTFFRLTFLSDENLRKVASATQRG